MSSTPPEAPRGAAEEQDDLDDRNRRGHFVPLALLSAAVLIWLGFQCWQLVGERSQLQQTRAAQEPLVQNATGFRARLDKVARETQRLADGGNANARLIVDELRKRGFTINPNAPPVGAAPAVAPKK